jgi:hypothetical protein
MLQPPVRAATRELTNWAAVGLSLLAGGVAGSAAAYALAASGDVDISLFILLLLVVGPACTLAALAGLVILAIGAYRSRSRQHV